jgi:hypothetical protein
VTLTNNLVITDAQHGITWMGLNGGKIINNTVLNDGYSTTNNKTWISVSPSKAGVPSNNVIVRNNASSYLAMNIKNTNITVENNVVSVGAAVPVAGVAKWLSKPGVFGTNNRIDPTLVSGFMLFDTVNKKYNLNLKPTSPAVNFGMAKDAPLVDILGRKRDATYDAGAYTFIK